LFVRWFVDFRMNKFFFIFFTFISISLSHSNGYNIGLGSSLGYLSGETFTKIPTGFTFIIGTPIGFKMGPFDHNISIGLGTYSGNYDSYDSSLTTEELKPMFLGFGGNLGVLSLLRIEGHVGIVGRGTGFRGFGGLSLERLMKRRLNLPVNLLFGSEIFYSNNISGVGNSSGWAGLLLRLDFNTKNIFQSIPKRKSLSNYTDSIFDNIRPNKNQFPFNSMKMYINNFFETEILELSRKSLEKNYSERGIKIMQSRQVKKLTLPSIQKIYPSATLQIKDETIFEKVLEDPPRNKYFSKFLLLYFIISVAFLH